MQEQKLETSDETIGILCKVEKHNSTQNRIRFKNKIAPIGDEVYAVTKSEHQTYLQKTIDADEYIAKINQLEFEINNADIRTLKQENESLKKQIKNNTNSINTFKTNSVKSKATIEDLQNKLDKYKQTIADKDATIKSLTSELNQLKFAVSEQANTIQHHETTIDELKEHNDAIAKQLDNSADASEIEDLKEQVATLTTKLKESETNAEYWQNSYSNLMDSSDALANKNGSLIAENEKLRNNVDAVNETNKLLNGNFIASNKTFKETTEQIQSDFQKQENALKETIEKHQSHIDELTDKYQSLLVLKEHIPQKQHYDEILALTDELNNAKNEINKLNNDIETKLATQKSDLQIAHADEIAKINLEHEQDKSKLFVAYNQELDNLKLQYNNLAKDYNNMVNDLHTITKWNALLDSRHEKIRKDKVPIELLEIQSEQSLSDKETIEYVPKDNITII